MERFTQRQIKSFGNEDKLWSKLEAWQNEHNTTALPHASALGLRKIGYSAGTDGCNGTLYEDVETKEVIGVGRRGCNIYID